MYDTGWGTYVHILYSPCLWIIMKKTQKISIRILTVHTYIAGKS